MRGANAAVVGVLLAALYNPVWLQGVHNARDVAAAFAALALLESWRAPPWLVVRSPPPRVNGCSEARRAPLTNDDCHARSGYLT